MCYPLWSTPRPALPLAVRPTSTLPVEDLPRLPEVASRFQFATPPTHPIASAFPIAPRKVQFATQSPSPIHPSIVPYLSLGLHIHLYLYIYLSFRLHCLLSLSLRPCFSLGYNTHLWSLVWAHAHKGAAKKVCTVSASLPEDSCTIRCIPSNHTRTFSQLLLPKPHSVMPPRSQQQHQNHHEHQSNLSHCSYNKPETISHATHPLQQTFAVAIAPPWFPRTLTSFLHQPSRVLVLLRREQDLTTRALRAMVKGA
jgi:hypothetical protein